MKWLDKQKGIFKINDPNTVSMLWGLIKILFFFVK